MGFIKYFISTKMAFMAMRKNLDERARRKELDAIFAKFDHNHNGRIYIKDFLAELKDHDMEISQAEVKKIMEFSDREGQLNRSKFESYCRESALMKSLDKNHDGIVSELEMTSKHEMAFKALDKNNDGYISKAEFANLAKTLPKDKVDAVMAKFDKDGDGKLDYEEFKKMIQKKMRIFMILSTIKMIIAF